MTWEPMEAEEVTMRKGDYRSEKEGKERTTQNPKEGREKQKGNDRKEMDGG